MLFFFKFNLLINTVVLNPLTFGTFVLLTFTHTAVFIDVPALSNRCLGCRSPGCLRLLSCHHDKVYGRPILNCLLTDFHFQSLLLMSGGSKGTSNQNILYRQSFIFSRICNLCKLILNRIFVLSHSFRNPLSRQ